MKHLICTIAIPVLLCGLFSCGPDTEPAAVTPTDAEESVSAAPKTFERVDKNLTPEMMTAFLRFRTAMLKKDRNVLISMSVDGLENGCAFEDADRDSTAYKLCDMLDEAQLQVLGKRTGLTSETEVKTDGCVYKDYFSVDDDGKGFYWSAGCIHVANEEEMGEYSTAFHFRLIDGKFRLDKAQCAG